MSKNSTEALPAGTYRSISTVEELDALELDGQACLRDANGELWIAFCTDDGDWYAVRPRGEDDGKSLDAGDPFRPIGPVLVEHDVPIPWVVSCPPLMPTPLAPEEQICSYSDAAHHSDDIVTVFCGRPAPVLLCGMHAQGNISHILASIPNEQKEAVR